MRNPSPEIVEVLLRAAIRQRVPLTVLEAIAYRESQYNPAAVGPTTSAGWQAKGLMQLSPATLGRYNVTDPFDAAQSAQAGAALVGHLVRGLNYDWPRVYAAYVWGARNVAQSARIPSQVAGYVQDVEANRRWLQNQAEPEGATIQERLNNAIHALADANPSDEEIKHLADTWAQYWDRRTPVLDDGVLAVPAMSTAWRRYAVLYDRAIFTNSRTPPPDKIQPTYWGQLTETFTRGRTQVDRAVETAKDLGSSAVSLAAAIGIGALVVVAFGERRRR